MEWQEQETYLIFLLIVHKRSNGPTLVSAGPGLSTNSDGSMANAEVVDGTRDSVERRRHLVRRLMIWEITRVVDGERPANSVPYIPSQLG